MGESLSESVHVQTCVVAQYPSAERISGADDSQIADCRLQSGRLLLADC